MRFAGRLWEEGKGEMFRRLLTTKRDSFGGAFGAEQV
jgi:hypothetical protein